MRRVVAVEPRVEAQLQALMRHDRAHENDPGSHMAATCQSFLRAPQKIDRSGYGYRPAPGRAG